MVTIRQQVLKLRKQDEQKNRPISETMERQINDAQLVTACVNEIERLMTKPNGASRNKLRRALEVLKGE